MLASGSLAVLMSCAQGKAEHIQQGQVHEQTGMKSHTVKVEAGVGERRGEGDAALLLAAEGDPWGLLVQANAKALQLVLYKLLVRDGFQAVQDDEDEVARPRCADDLRIGSSLTREYSSNGMAAITAT